MAAKSLSELRKMDRNQIDRIKKDDLINIILAPEPATQGTTDELLAELIAEIRGQRTEIRELKESFAASEEKLNSRINELESRSDKKDQIILKQQQFCESVDQTLRETKLVLLGVPDESESLDGATSEDAKVAKVWEAIGNPAPIQSHVRLGRAGAGRRRPVLVHVASRAHRDAVLDKAKRLKDDQREELKKIYIKRDEHPAFRREWNRLRTLVRTEQARPENVNCNIRLDTKERKVFRDDVEIASWGILSF